MLEAESAVTLYQQIADDILEKIKSGEYAEGQMLPSEAKFCEIYGVSRVTVRSAISDLVDRELVVRRHGKGTFVAKKKIDSNLFHFEGFTTACKRNHVSTHTRILRAERVPATPYDIRELKLQPGADVILLSRLRIANGIPVIIEHVRLSAEKYGFLLDIDMEDKSLYAVLGEHTGSNPEDYCNVTLTLEVGAATPEEAELLEIETGMPLFILKETITSQETGLPVHWTKQVMSGNYFKYTITSSNNTLGINLKK